MLDISNKVLDLMLREGIERKDICSQLSIISMEIQYQLWEKISLSPYIFYTLKDTIYYNFEFLDNNEIQTGKFNIKDYGKNYPTLMFEIDENGYMDASFVENFVKELDDINSKFNENIQVAVLDNSVDFEWIVDGDKSTKILFYDKYNEKPSKYGYRSSGNKYSGILDNNGNQIVTHEDVILCPIYKIDVHREYTILYNVLQNITNVAKKALNNKKGIFFNFN